MSTFSRFAFQGIQIHRPIIYGNSAHPIPKAERDSSANPDHSHRWTVAVRSAASFMGDTVDGVGGNDDLSYFIKRVTFRLHETYPQPTRSIEKPPFEVTETGWGEFEINIKIQFVAEAGEKTISFMHHLKLHPWGVPDLVADNPNLIDPVHLYVGPPTGPDPYDPDGQHVPLRENIHAWQYDEIVFTDPPKAFLDILLANPPTLLPKTSKRPAPANVAWAPSLASIQLPPGTPAIKAYSSTIPEFTQQLEQQEAERLDAAKRSVLDAIEEQRKMLAEKEEELRRLKEQLDIT
ncbi:yeats-domain-containing protein [Clavulina sp. PMI_390]|nr:yeats-domain-containing protein [Clavulina sp. PMI_390]